MEFQELLKKYAELVVRTGCCLQAGQELYITSPVCCADFTRLVAECAYLAGAKQVTVRWTDEKLARLNYEYSPQEVFEVFPEWMALLQNGMAERNAAILSIDASDPTAMAGVDPHKIAAMIKAAHTACKPFYDGMNQGKVIWCIVAAASPAWAKKVYPELSEADAVSQLWNAILKASRADHTDPVLAWEEHRKSFETKKSLLNRSQFTSLRYINGLGTDITIGLPENHEWAGGGAETTDGRYFFPNIPTEEIFCTPNKDLADGIVYSALPLNYQGNLIEDFSLTFEKGRIVDFHAAKGGEILKELIATDEGSHHLGEVALIPKKSPISEMNTIFFNTLYDENASCHFAIGRGFSECIKGGFDMSPEQLLAAGINESATHVDFMLGTDDLRVVGIAKDGSEVLLFENGNWSTEFQNMVDSL